MPPARARNPCPQCAALTRCAAHVQVKPRPTVQLVAASTSSTSSGNGNSGLALHPHLSVLLASEVAVGRLPQLLASVPGTQLLVAAVGCDVLLLDTATAAATPDWQQPRPVKLLPPCPATVAAVAASSPVGIAGRPGALRWWTAALAGSEACFVRCDYAAAAAAAASDSSIPSCSSDAAQASVAWRLVQREGLLAWQACSWQPGSPDGSSICALLSPQRLCLVASPPPQPQQQPTSGCSILVDMTAPDTAATSSSRCCLAWLPSPAQWSLAVQWGAHQLELLRFDSGDF